MGSTLLEPIKQQRLHEKIASRLESLILDGSYPPGASLPTELELCEKFQVSRTVVRDAIRVLATKGLLEIRHGVGAFVTASGRERLAEALEISTRRGDYQPWEMFVMRRGLELIVVEEAIRHASREQIAEMRRAVAGMYAAQDPVTGNSEAGHREHLRFHQTMVNSTGNRILMDLLEPITVFRIPYNLGLDVYSPTPEQLESYVRRHEAIVDALENRNEAEAKEAMLHHLEDLEQRALHASDMS